ncbi:MAG: CoB--CoM heterodisulfide reductase iron-sulfur subunit A family protein [Deltaproteobacteria bacterium]|nr:CoB--CoM heterodisulfide reductase iron-sulfur subunit A family protein [Deltaproteobacteria bacterium]
MSDNKSILVVGGGISGITAAVEAAEVGYNVCLVEKNAYLGGRVAQNNQYFPKLCPPSCGLEINFRRIKNNSRIKLFTLAEVEEISGEEGAYAVKIKINPRYVNENCTACGDCAEVCSTEIPNEFNYGMDKVKGAYLPNEFAFPMRYVISPEIIGTEDARKCKDACKYNAVDLEMQPETINIKVGSVIWATGWQPFDPGKVEYYGFNKHKNVITNVMMERLASQNGPTRGKIVRPSDDKEIESIAFVQCAGSRDENYLPFCSSVCCLASLKHATYVRDQYPEAKIYIFYIDIRALGRYEEFYVNVSNDDKVFLIKGKVAEIIEDPGTGALTVTAEDQMSGKLTKETVDMVVLATGMVPTTVDIKVPADVTYDENGFIVPDDNKRGIYGTGCVKRPMDVASSVQSATAAALKAIQSTVRG